MPQFTALDDQQREAIITFVLGLVAEPPATQYVYHAAPRREAIAQGLQVIEKFNCTGCHALEVDQWELAYEPGDFPEPPEVADYPFLQAHFTPQQIEASQKTDDRGLLHATVTGMPSVDEEGNPLRVDEDGAPIDADDNDTKAFYSFVPWENALINGQICAVGTCRRSADARVADRKAVSAVRRILGAARLSDRGGRRKDRSTPNAKPDEAWGWLPPPLVGEGRKVQTDWLHDFLLDPYPIRPAVVLRMPKFNMSPAEATQAGQLLRGGRRRRLSVRLRSAHARVAPRGRERRASAPSGRRAEDRDRQQLLREVPPAGRLSVRTGSERAKAPQLDEVYKRLRPELHARLGSPIPSGCCRTPACRSTFRTTSRSAQSLYNGTSEQQLNAVVDLLLNYDRFMESKTSIKPLIKAGAAGSGRRQAIDLRPGDAAQ